MMHSKNNVTEDTRFSKVFRDSKFKNLPKRKSKVKIDKRFQSMFTDDAFQVKYSIDKRGRRISRSTTEDLNKFYHISSSDENDSNVETADQYKNHQSQETSKKKSGLGDIPSLTQEEEDMIRKKRMSGKVRKKLKDMNVDYARGEGRLFSDSSSDESESEDSEFEVYHEWNELDKDAEYTETLTRRLAVCNMDWDKVRALDLMALFRSFLPPGGVIHSVAIYPSEFGLKRLAEEEMKGPAELVNVRKDSTSESDTDDEAEEYRTELMREYQINRLKYYYAVAVFDSPETADIIYNSCNGFEYGKSGILLDLRFINDDMTFDHEPKDICDSNVNLHKYTPLDFTNTALQQTKVELTWDETDPRRRELTQRITEAAKNGDVNDSDLEDLVALSGSDEEDDDDILEALKKNSTSEEFAPFEDLMKKCKTTKGNQKGKRMNEIQNNVFSEEGNDDLASKKPSKKSGKSCDDETAEKQKGELQLLLLDENTDNRHHFSLKKLQESDKKKCKKRKSKKDAEPLQDDFIVDVNDDRFSALYSSNLYNIDPTDSNYRKTKGMQAFVLEKQKRLSQKGNNWPSRDETSKMNTDEELSLLVKSVKSKTKSLLKNKMNKPS